MPDEADVPDPVDPRGVAQVAGEVEQGLSSSQYRFGACRAYRRIWVPNSTTRSEGRLKALVTSAAGKVELKTTSPRISRADSRFSEGISI